MCSKPSIYQFYTNNDIVSGLTTTPDNFLLNDKVITLYSGALHYFRVHPELWRDRLRKLRAAGLNCVETYFCWNLHEPEPGVFDFGDGKTDFEAFLNIEHFLTIAKEEDLLVIARPGPYICAEWDFGGLPSWILRNRNPNIKIRTSDESYIEIVERYFTKLLSILGKFQFTKGGPIIAFQIENEYGNVKEEDKPIDTEYLLKLKDLFHNSGIVELLFTSDTPSNGFFGSIPDVLYTANFQEDPESELSLLKQHQPDKPLMVMEYWTGWFDHWAEKHHTRSNEAFSDVFERILKYPSSVNMYMFHGGTNWGFLNGANIKDRTTNNSAYQPDTSSYDYDAPLSEAGDYTDKYISVREHIIKNSDIETPKMPELKQKIAYEEINIVEEIDLENLLKNIESIESENLIAMEMLNINNNSGQKYGYIVYRIANIKIKSNSVLKIEGHVCDTIIVLINGKIKTKIPQNNEDLNGFGFWRLENGTLNLGPESYESATLDLVVENMGRVNYGKLNQFNQFKGLWQGSVSINEQKLNNWEIFPLEFKTKWTGNLQNWQKASFGNGPKLYKGVLNILSEPKDTYIDMRKWVKGIVIINGFVLSRYFKLGPQQACYLPAPFLKTGANVILIFEHYTSNHTINFSENQIYQSA